MLYIAKGILVAASLSFSIALIRTSERLTMPLTQYLKMVEYQAKNSSGKDAESGANALIELLRRAIELMQTGRDQPKG